MESSPEKTSRKHMDIIEKKIKKTLQNGLKESIINEYLEVMKEDLLVGQQDDFFLNLIQQDEQDNVERDFLRNNYATLSENVELNRQKFESLKDSIDILSMQSIAEKETFKRQQNDGDNKIKLMYQGDINKVNQQLEEINNEYNEIEQELRKQISLENATKNARIYEMRSKLERQIMDKRNDIVRLITEGNTIKQELDNLKAQLEQNRYKNTHKNMMYFNKNYVDQQSTLNKPVHSHANFTKSNNSQDKLEYNTDKQNQVAIASEYDLLDKHQQVLENNHLLEKVNNTTFGNMAINQHKKDFLNPVSHTSNLKPNSFSYTTNTDPVIQVESKEQSSSKTKDDHSISMDEIVSSNSSQITPTALPPRRIPKVYIGTTKKGQLGKLRK
ncbi:unnamed protein product [Ceutorhynchus assimilis]|uniref:Uncharacterized protein n=1 Tax=Ceutorhynchus assimilis TaxID=467358 RepID=A0A9N9MP48_9CUCU|nr:unnamed protein product [Ceutorhynchus assimilis]